MSKQMPYPVVSRKTEGKKTKASITVEAALAFPIFFFACMAMCYLFIFIKTQYIVEREMYTVARELSAYGTLIEPVAELRNSVLKEAEDTLYGKDSAKALAAHAVEAVSALLPETNGFSIKNFVTATADSILLESILGSYVPEEVFKYTYAYATEAYLISRRDYLPAVRVAVAPYVNGLATGVCAVAAAPLLYVPRLASVCAVEHKRYSRLRPQCVKHVHKVLVHVLKGAGRDALLELRFLEVFGGYHASSFFALSYAKGKAIAASRRFATPNCGTW